MYLTLDEQEKHAYLSGNPLPEALLDLAEAGETFMEIRGVGDVKAGFPDEGFLDDILDELDSLIRTTHKNNKLIPDLIRIREALSEKQNEVSHSAEYGRAELEKLEIALGIS